MNKKKFGKLKGTHLVPDGIGVISPTCPASFTDFEGLGSDLVADGVGVKSPQIESKKDSCAKIFEKIEFKEERNSPCCRQDCGNSDKMT